MDPYPRGSLPLNRSTKPPAYEAIAHLQLREPDFSFLASGPRFCVMMHDGLGAGHESIDLGIKCL